MGTLSNILTWRASGCRPLLILSFLFVLNVVNSRGQWTSDVAKNTPVSLWQGERFVEDLLSDGNGGAYLVWDDYSNYSPTVRVFVQKISTDGSIQWHDDGILVSLSTATQVTPQFCSDGKGGIIIAWLDERNGNYDIFAQRINPEGQRLWGDQGIPITTADYYQDLRSIVPADEGGALIVWKDGRYTIDGDIFAQKVDSNGIVRWMENGAPVCVLPGEHGGPDIVSDGIGGAFVVWDDNRPGSIYMQHLDIAGFPIWAENGIPICTHSSCGGGIPQILSDGLGGSIVLWKKIGIHAQKVSTSGNLIWGTGGIQVMDSSGYKHKIASDGKGGVIVATGLFLPSVTRTDIYAQKITSTGTLPWGSNRTSICTTHTSDLRHPRITADGEGGAIITWGDLRNDSIDIYAQKVDSLGTTLWEINGVPVSRASRTQQWPFVISNGHGGGIFTWYADNRNALTPPPPWYDDIYIQNLDRYGYPGMTTPSIDTIEDVSGDQGGFLRISWKPTHLDRDSLRVVTSYTLSRWSDSIGAWQFLVSIPATSESSYSVILPSLADSTKNGIKWEIFTIQALNSDSTKLWTSVVDSGYSVDNIAPTGVAELFAEMTPDSSVILHWPPNLVDADLRAYMVYRRDSSNVLLDPFHLATVTDTVFIDSSYIVGMHSGYRIIVEDIHDNSSPPSPEAMVSTQSTFSFAFPKTSWELLSIPLDAEAVLKDSIFPGMSGVPAYLFDGSYRVVDSLVPGMGFWIKIPSADTILLSGFRRMVDTIPLTAGWNLLGSLSVPLAIDQVETVPPGLVASRFFEYDGGSYVPTDFLLPGRGYWVKASSAGLLILSALP